MFSLSQNIWELILMTNNRISKRFSQLKKDGRTALVSYVMGGDPDTDTSLSAIKALRDNGADVIELGFPFTDPTADGVSIQKAGLRSLSANTNLSNIFELVDKFRQSDQDTPLILMGYTNPVYAMGYEKFALNCAECGVDGVIIVDLPIEEDRPLRQELETRGLSIINLVTPTTTSERLTRIAESASGFIYYVAVAGITGSKSANPEEIRLGIESAQKATNLPVCVGFGIRTGEQASGMARIADGIVVGSAFVEIIEQEIVNKPNFNAIEKNEFSAQITARLGELTRELSSAISSKT